MPTATAAKTVTFHSRFLRLELVRVPKLQQPLATGGWMTTQKGVSYRFEPSPTRSRAAREGGDPEHEGAAGGWVGVLKVTEGQDVLEDQEGWLAADQEQGVERDAVAALKAHRSFGQDFWIVGHEPGTLYPRPKEFHAALNDAAVARDEDRILAMLEEERSTHGRPDLLDAAESALEAVRLAALSDPTPEPTQRPGAAQKGGK